MFEFVYCENENFSVDSQFSCVKFNLIGSPAQISWDEYVKKLKSHTQLMNQNIQKKEYCFPVVCILNRLNADQNHSIECCSYALYTLHLFVNAVKLNSDPLYIIDHCYFAVNRFEFVPTHEATQPSIRMRAYALCAFIIIYGNSRKHTTCIHKVC